MIYLIVYLMIGATLAALLGFLYVWKRESFTFGDLAFFCLLWPLALLTLAIVIMRWIIQQFEKWLGV